MFDKLSDTANILKAKITKDELQEKLVLATSEQNWQTPTNVLHQIANAAFNYQKWQKINDFIWDKLKKKTTWRKIIKTLNLVEFLLKNGPPSAISSFKYDVYQFRSFSDYSSYHDGIDRGESIRQKAKQIVDLLSNEQLLEEQRQKAKKIRQKMSGVTGTAGYGGYGGNSGHGDSKYGNYNNKSYNQKSSGYSSGSTDYAVGLGAYGDYNYNKSTLDKYKQKGTISSKTTSSNIPDITGGNGSNVTSSITQNPNVQQVTKKPFEKIAPKLVKPSTVTSNKTTTPVNGTSSAKTNNNIVDFDLFDTASPTTPTNTNTNTQVNKPNIVTASNNNGVNATNNIGIVPPVQNVQPHPQPVQNINPPPSTTPGFNFNQFYTQPQPQPQPNFGLNQPFGYGQQPYGQAFNQPYGQQYGQSYPMQFQQYPQSYAQPGAYPQSYAQPQINPTTYNIPTQPIQPIQQIQPIQTNQISLSSKAKQQDDFGNFESAPSKSTANVNWLSSQQKGLIDLSDFSNELKNMPNSPKKSKQQKGNRIEIDPWKW